MPVRSYQSILQLLTYYIHIIHVRNLDPFSKNTRSQQSNVTFPLRVTNSEERKAALELYRTMSDLGYVKNRNWTKDMFNRQSCHVNQQKHLFLSFLIFFEWKNDHPDWPTSAPSWDHPRISLILGTSVTSCTMVVTPLRVSSSPVISPPTTNAPRLRPRTWLSSSEKCSSRDLRRNGNGSFACWGHRDDDQPWTFQDLVVQSADRICSNTRPERYVTWWAKKGGYLVWSIN